MYPDNLEQIDVVPPHWSSRATAAVEVVLCSGFPSQILLVVVLAALGMVATDPSGTLSLRWVVVLSMTDAILILGLVFYFLHRNGELVFDVFLGSRSPRRELIIGVILTPVVLGLALAGASVLHYLWPGIRNVPENPFQALIRSPLNAAVFTVVAVVAGGIREELQRAFILRRFEQHLGGGWIGLVIFSIAFGLGHLIQGWDAVIVTTLLGALWGATYLIRRSVVSTIVSHAGFNVTEILLTLSGIGSGTV